MSRREETPKDFGKVTMVRVSNGYELSFRDESRCMSPPPFVFNSLNEVYEFLLAEEWLPFRDE